jgi:hypothetical protein
MEIKRYPSIYFFLRDMKEDLFNIDLNNSADDELSLLSPQLKIHEYSSECKGININKWRKIN